MGADRRQIVTTALFRNLFTTSLPPFTAGRFAVLNEQGLFTSMVVGDLRRW
jgi:hypothetical protein